MNIEKNRKGFLFLISLTPIAYVLNIIAQKYPYHTENIYSSKIYPIISKISYDFINFIPFSLAEILLVAIITFLIAFVVYCFYHLFRKRFKKLKKIIINFISIATSIASIMYFVFITTCGLNYARPSYINLIGYQEKQYTTQELEELCYYLVEQCNDSKEGLIYNNTKSNEVFADYSNRAKEIYNNYENPSNIINGEANRAKPVVLSTAMSYANITGIYIPFTFESNFNKDAPNHTIPSAILHEIAHYKGFMREQDANFLAYIVGTNSNDQEFIYSSNYMALGYCLNAYYKATTPEEYNKLFANLSPEVVADIRTNSNYWEQFNTPVASMSEKINDNYLKHNYQESGTQSYGEMVDSVLIYYHENIKRR